MTTPPRNHDDDSDYDERYEDDDYDTVSPDDDGERRIKVECPNCNGFGYFPATGVCEMCNGTGEW